MSKIKTLSPHVPYSEELGNFFKNQRQKSGLSQWEMAEALGYETAQVVSNWERGVQSPPFAKLTDVCKLLKVSPDAMIRKLLNVQQSIYTSSLKSSKKVSVGRRVATSSRRA
jgi:transcriptional regulator with XRE-family HTH domain